MSNKFILTLMAAVVSFLLTPLIKRFAKLVNVMDIPKDERRIHRKPIPLLGGLAIYFAFVSVLILKAGPLSRPELGILIGATIITIGGFIDDAIDIKPWQKLIFQVSAAMCLIIFGVRISLLTNPLPGNSLFVDIGWFSYPLTIVWIVGITNALNLIDGLDGLAAGVAFISSVTIFIIAILNNRLEASILTSILCGAILGFLPFNFNPASIFMGDTGAQLLGFLLAAISLEGAIKSAAAFAIAVPIMALGLPIYDTLFAMIRRKMNGKPITQADRGHLHHRLLDMGLTQKQVVIIMYLFSAVLGAVSIIAMQLSGARSYFLLTFVILVIVLLAWKLGFFKHRE